MSFRPNVPLLPIIPVWGHTSNATDSFRSITGAREGAAVDSAAALCARRGEAPASARAAIAVRSLEECDTETSFH